VKRGVLVTAALVAAVAVWGVSLPPRRTALPSSWTDGTVRGILHVHSRVSDGRGTLDDIARAAAAAGLQFVVVTDHGDGTRRPEAASYRSGVLVIDAVEISTRGGHYVALGLPRAPFVLAGEAADVVEDVHRLGGFGIAAHPDSPKEELKWKDWGAAVDGFELLNPDTSWRVHAFSSGAGSRWLLIRSLLSYPVRPSESIAQLFTADSALRERWMSIAAQRPLVVVAGADAHAKLAFRDTEPGDNSNSVPIPSYQSSFGALSVHVTPERPFSGDPASDSASLLSGIKLGHVYVSVDGWAATPSFQFTATSGPTTITAGDTMPAGQPLTLHVRSNAPGGFETVVWKGTEALTTRTENEFEVAASSEPAVYRVEIRRPNSPGMPAWLTGNPIYVRATGGVVPKSSEDAELRGGTSQPLFDGSSTNGWSPESDSTSLAVVDLAKLADGARVRLRFGLAGGSAVGQYSAAAVETATGVGSADALAFSIRAETPMRISLQVRAEVAGAAPERWQKSVFVDTAEQERVVRFGDMTPVGITHEPRPPKANVRAVMFVVDTTNTRPGASGRLWIGNPRLLVR
jgi:hypothetical protein